MVEKPIKLQCDIHFIICPSPTHDVAWEWLCLVQFPPCLLQLGTNIWKKYWMKSSRLPRVARVINLLLIGKDDPHLMTHELWRMTWQIYLMLLKGNLCDLAKLYVSFTNYWDLCVITKLEMFITCFGTQYWECHYLLCQTKVEDFSFR